MGEVEKHPHAMDAPRIKLIPIPSENTPSRQRRRIEQRFTPKGKAFLRTSNRLIIHKINNEHRERFKRSLRHSVFPRNPLALSTVKSYPNLHREVIAMSVQKIEFNDANFEAETRVGLSVVCFEDPLDRECRKEVVLVEKAANTIAERIKLGTCDIESCPILAERFRVTRIPTILIIKEGKEVDRLTGFRHEKALIKHLQKHLRKVF